MEVICSVWQLSLLIMIWFWSEEERREKRREGGEERGSNRGREGREEIYKCDLTVCLSGRDGGGRV